MDYKLFEKILPLELYKNKDLKQDNDFFIKILKLTDNNITIYSNLNGTISKMNVEIINEKEKWDGLILNDEDKYEINCNEKYLIHFINFLNINKIFELLNKNKKEKDDFYKKIKFENNVIVDNGNLGNSIFFHGFISILKLLSFNKLINNNNNFYYALVFNYTINKEFSYFQSIEEYEFYYSDEIIIFSDFKKYLINKFAGKTFDADELNKIFDKIKIELKKHLKIIENQIDYNHFKI